MGKGAGLITNDIRTLRFHHSEMTQQALADRVGVTRQTVNAIEGIAASHPGERIVIACHGGVICAYLGWILGISQDMWFRPAHTSVQIVRARDQVRAIDSTGDTRHLLTAEGDLRTY